MAHQLTPYAYRPGATFLHRMYGGVKLLGLFLVSLIAFFSGPGLAVSGLILILGAISAKIRPWELLRGSRPIVVIAFFVLILRTLPSESETLVLNLSGFYSGVLFGVGLIISFSAGSLLFSVTTMMELRDSLGKSETFLRSVPIMLLKKSSKEWAVHWVRRLEKSRISHLSLGISLMLGFLPRFFAIWEEVTAAYQARAGKKGVSQMILLIPLVTERMIERAMETATALESRGVLL
jgi:biotin transport system permease protein